MKRKLALALAMVMGFSFNAFAADQSVTNQVVGTSDVRDPIIQLMAPTSFNVVVDPYELNAKNSGIGNNLYVSGSSNGFAFANKSEVPLDLTVSVVGDSDTTFVSEAGLVTSSAVTTSALRAYATIAPFTVVGTLVLSPTSLGTTTAKSEYSVPFTSNATGASLRFRLKEASYTGTTPTFSGVAAANAGVAGFTIMGKVNPNAAWSSGKMDVTVKYTAKPISPSVYGTLVTIAGPLNVIDMQPSEDADPQGMAFAIPAPGTAPQGIGTIIKGGTADLTLLWTKRAGVATVASIRVVDAVTGEEIVPDALPTATDTVQIAGTAALPTGIKVNKNVSWSAGDKFVYVTFNNGGITQFKVTVKAQ